MKNNIIRVKAAVLTEETANGNKRTAKFLDISRPDTQIADDYVMAAEKQATDYASTVESPVVDSSMSATQQSIPFPPSGWFSAPIDTSEYTRFVNGETRIYQSPSAAANVIIPPASTNTPAAEDDTEFVEFVPSVFGMPFSAFDDMEVAPSEAKLSEDPSIIWEPAHDEDEETYADLDTSSAEENLLERLDLAAAIDAADEALYEFVQRLHAGLIKVSATCRVAVGNLSAPRGAHERPRQPHRLPHPAKAAAITLVVVLLCGMLSGATPASANGGSVNSYPIRATPPVPFQAPIDPWEATLTEAEEAWANGEVFFFTTEELDHFVARADRQLVANLLASEGTPPVVGETGSSQIVWVILNRLDSNVAWFGCHSGIQGVVKKQGQFTSWWREVGSEADFAIVEDVINRWIAEQHGVPIEASGRTLPKNFYAYSGNLRDTNYFWRFASGLPLGRWGETAKIYYHGSMGTPYAS